MIQFGFEQSGSIGLLYFDGALTKQYSSEMKTALMRALHRVDHLIFNLEKVTAIDAACFQVLCMAQRISASLNKRLTVTGFRQKSFKRLFEESRFRHTECFLDCLRAVCRGKHAERGPHRETQPEPCSARANARKVQGVGRGGAGGGSRIALQIGKGSRL